MSPDERPIPEDAARTAALRCINEVRVDLNDPVIREITADTIARAVIVAVRPLIEEAARADEREKIAREVHACPESSTAWASGFVSRLAAAIREGGQR